MKFDNFLDDKGWCLCLFLEKIIKIPGNGRTYMYGYFSDKNNHNKKKKCKMVKYMFFHLFSPSRTDNWSVFIYFKKYLTIINIFQN